VCGVGDREVNVPDGRYAVTYAISPSNTAHRYAELTASLPAAAADVVAAVSCA